MRRGFLIQVAAALCLALASGQAHATEESDISRGAYLVAVAACAGCHTPRTPTGLGPALSGGRTFGTGAAAVSAPNITPDRATGVGTWSDAEIAAAIHDGRKPDGSRIGPPMPQVAYRAMRDDDVRAIVAYLRSVPAIDHAVPVVRRSVPPSGDAPPAIVPNDSVARGRYLANAVTHCTECHTPGSPAAPDFAARLDAGGRVFATHNGPLVAPAITSMSLRRYSDAALLAIITRGERADGTMLEGPMPVASFARLRPSDLAALVAFLRKN